MRLLTLLVALLCCTLILSAPAPTKAPSASPSHENVEAKLDVDDENAEAVNTGLFYDAYLQEVVKLLESNEDFKKKMQTADFDDIKAGKLSNEVNFMPQHIRDKLSDLKRQEMSRLRKIVQAKSDLDNGRKVKKSHHLTQIANHLDHNNPHTFEASDLTNLIKAATSDLENFDQERHEDFKKYEMKKELQREEKLKKLNEIEREKAKEEYLKKQQEMAKNNGMHHPGSKAQLEDVWNEEDGLAEQEFDPRTFFKLHDLNGDGYLDAMEMEALFEKDLESVYNSSDPNFDFVQMEEERRRMREHVIKEVDKDGDGIVSLAEFIGYTQTEEFANPDEESYKTIDQLLMEHSLYTQEELERYRSSIEQQEQDIKQKLELLKSEAKNLGGLRRELSDEKMVASRDGIQEDEKIRLEIKEAAVKEKEQQLQDLHRDLQEQSKEVLQMKQEVKKHEVGEKVAEQIKEKLDNLPPGEEKDRAVEQAHKELENLQKVQGMVSDEEPHPMDPNAQPMHPNAQPQHPNAQPMHPNAQPQHPNAQPQHPNAQPQHPNAQPQHPNAQPQYPNAQPQHPNAQAQHPNVQPQHPNAQPQHPNAQPHQP